MQSVNLAHNNINYLFDSRKINLVMLFKFAITIDLLSSINLKIIAENARIGKN
jgi:hypothetical protein